MKLPFSHLGESSVKLENNIARDKLSAWLADAEIETQVLFKLKNPTQNSILKFKQECSDYFSQNKLSVRSSKDSTSN